jgi:hypothetical protein
MVQCSKLSVRVAANDGEQERAESALESARVKMVARPATSAFTSGAFDVVAVSDTSQLSVPDGSRSRRDT